MPKRALEDTVGPQFVYFGKSGIRPDLQQTQPTSRPTLQQSRPASSAPQQNRPAPPSIIQRPSTAARPQAQLLDREEIQKICDFYIENMGECAFCAIDGISVDRMGGAFCTDHQNFFNPYKDFRASLDFTKGAGCVKCTQPLGFCVKVNGKCEVMDGFKPFYFALWQHPLLNTLSASLGVQFNNMNDYKAWLTDPIPLTHHGRVYGHKSFLLLKALYEHRTA